MRTHGCGAFGVEQTGGPRECVHGRYDRAEAHGIEELLTLLSGKPRQDQPPRALDIVAAARHPPVQRLASLLELRSADAPHAHRVTEPEQHLGNPVETRLVDLRLRLSGPPALLTDRCRPPVAVEESRGPRQLVLVQLS